MLFLAGVNHVFFHGATYSPADAPWPGWLFYASTDSGPESGFWPAMPALSAHVARIQASLQEATPGRATARPRHGPPFFRFEFVRRQETKWVMVCALLLALLHSSPGPAGAAASDRPIFVHIKGAVPFSSEELIDAVSLRAAVAEEPEPEVMLVLVEPRGDGVQVRSAARTQLVPLDGMQGKEAARLVALAIADVWREPLSRVPPPPPLSVALAGGSQLGLTNGSPDLEVTAQAQYRLVGAWAASVEVGYSRSFSMSDPVVQRVGADAVLHSVPVRVGAAYRRGWFGLAAGGVVRTYFAGGASHVKGVLPGGFALVALAVPVGGPWSLRFTAGCEAYPTTQGIRVDDATLARFTRQRIPLETNHLAPFVAAGVAWH
jgi:hypothetical protein